MVPDGPPARSGLGGGQLTGPATPAPPIPASVPSRLPAATANTDIPLRAAWMLSVAILLGAIGATIHWRFDIMQAWPPSTRVLSVFGGLPAR